MQYTEKSGSKALPFIPDLSVVERQTLQAKTAASFSIDVQFCDRLQDGSHGPDLTVIPAGVF